MSLSPRLIAVLTLPPLLWSGNIVLGRWMVPQVPPFALNAMRWTVAVAALLLLGWRALATPAARQAVRRRWGYLLALGLLGAGGYNAMQYVALITSSVLNVALITACMPVWMIVIGRLFFREHPARRQYMSAGLSLVGVALVLSRGDMATLRSVQFVPGDLVMLAATACWALYSWLLARPPAHMRGEARPMLDDRGETRPWNWAEFLLLQALFGLLWAGGAAGIESVVSDRVVHWSPAVVAGVVYLALGPSVLAYWFWGEGVARGPQLTAFFSNLTPVFAGVLSTVLLGEWPQWWHGAAFACIVAGIWVSARR